MMSLIQFLKSRTFRVNFVASVSIVIILLIITFWSLKIYTRHGRSYQVPDFTGMSIIKSKQTARNQNLRVKITDSLYREGVLPGSVIDQFPEPGFKVKSNRTISLTINSSTPENVVVPNLKDISFRQAQSLIENCGLKIGSIKYKPSEFDNLVLAVLADSAEINAGDKILKGTRLDMVVGKSTGNFMTTVPDLTSLSLVEGKELIASLMLNIGVVIYDETIKTAEDSASTIIWRQQPDPRVVTEIDLGTSIDLWVTLDSLKINTENDLKIE